MWQHLLEQFKVLRREKHLDQGTWRANPKTISVTIIIYFKYSWLRWSKIKTSKIWKSFLSIRKRNEAF
jgi:hypothetical protein